MRLFSRFILRPLVAQKLRTALTVLGIALGVAVVVAVRLANQSSVAGFSAALDAVSGAASLEIVSPGAGLDERRVADLGWLRAFGAVAPVIEGDAFARPPDGASEAVRVLGVDILRDQPFRRYRLLRQAGVDRPPPPQDILAMLVDPDAVILTERFARAHRLRTGDRLELDIGDLRRWFVVKALLADEGPARVLDGNFVLMDIAAAQVAFGRLGSIDRLDVRLRDPGEIASAEQAIAARLRPGLAVQRPARRGEQVETMLRAFQFNLTALAYVALLVGLFLVYNTVAVSVIARREEIGMLRALGATRRTVLALFLGEAAALSVSGAVVGVGAGLLLARAAVRLTATTVNTLYIASAAVVPPIDLREAAVAIGVGVVLSVLAAAGPAREASRVAPVAAITGGDRAATRRRIGARRALAGVAMLVAAWVLSLLGPVRGLPVFGFAAAVATVFGIAGLVPAVLTLLARGGRRGLGRLLGVEGALAHANLAGAIPRLAVSVAALAVALSMMVAIAIMIGSFRETVVYWVGQTLTADLFVATARRSNLESQGAVSPELAHIIASDPAVDLVNGFRSLNLVYDGRLTVLGASDFRVLRARGRLLFKEPRDAAAAVDDALRGDAVLVSEAFARKAGRHAGDTVSLQTPQGARPFRIAGVYYDYTTDRGVVAMDRRTFARYFGDLPPTSLSIFLRPGADAEAVRARLLRRLGDRHRVFIHTNRSLRAEVLRVFDSTFAITYALEGIAILVAILGVAATLLTLILERRDELSTLRLIGADRRQVRRMVVIEAGLIGVVSQALGLVAGLALACILIYVVNVQSFGWTIQFSLPVIFLLQMSAVLTAATSLAGLYPARVASAVAPVRREVG